MPVQNAGALPASTVLALVGVVSNKPTDILTEINSRI
jgi:hypothetical protein